LHGGCVGNVGNQGKSDAPGGPNPASKLFYGSFLQIDSYDASTCPPEQLGSGLADTVTGSSNDRGATVNP
jgi:hypothetical protein